MSKVYAKKVPGNCDYLTAGKRYEIEWLEPQKSGDITADDGSHSYILINNCRHLDGGNWTVEEDAEAAPSHSREYPVRIHAGHLGGGRRTWKPELMDAHEAAHTCEYVRADVVAEMQKTIDDQAFEIGDCGARVMRAVAPGSSSLDEALHVLETKRPLIAAAPDMLDALKQAKVKIGARMDRLTAVQREVAVNEAWHILDAAIAKYEAKS